MTALAIDTKRQFASGIPPEFQDFLVKTNTTIFSGGAVVVEQANGYARPLAASLTVPIFLGYAEEGAANNPGADGAKSVTCRQNGTVFTSAIAGATGIVDIGKVVYMLDDDAFTLTSVNNVEVGNIENYFGGQFLVRFQATALR